MMGMARPYFLFASVFTIMALSNAIVPVLPDLATDDLSLQTLIFSAYFFGAMITTLPGGIVSDRIGQPVLIKAALIITLISGLLISGYHTPNSMLLWRLIEGIGAGIFISSGLSWIGYQKDSLKNTGFFMASLNMGLLFGLIGSGWLTKVTGEILFGVWIFTAITILLLAVAYVSPLPRVGTVQDTPSFSLLSETRDQILRQAPLWFSVIILLGSTGYVQAVFPELSNYPAHEISVVLAAMNFATIITSLATPYLKIEPVMLIRISAVMIIPLLFVFIIVPASVLVIGAVAGLIMVSQVGYLAMAEEKRGIAMGLYSTFSYAGMTLIPAIGGVVIPLFSFEAASLLIATGAVLTAVIIGRCRCKGVIIS